MPTLTWPPHSDIPPADEDQKRVALRFKEFGKVAVEAPPGTGKTFLGVYLALCAYRLGWTSRHRPTLFLTFSRNARVQIEYEVSRFQKNKVDE
jgi:superfamily II DNA/RNA helicase